MTSLVTFLLLHVFTAVLPPPSDDVPENEYYSILGFSSPSLKRISQEDIRKAYRSLSLQLHPDKIAQRGGNAAEAAARYEKVQQAYSVLSDPKERRKYHAVNCSVERYKFVYQQGWMHPMSLLQNLSKASCWDKFRLVLVVAFVLCLALLQPILLAAKVNAVLGADPSHALYNAHWNLIWIPFYVLYGLGTLLQLAMFALTKNRDIFLSALQQVCILVGIILLSREWDDATDTGRPMDSVKWYKLGTPFYLAIGLRVAGISEGIKALASFHEKLVSPDRMQEIQHEKGHLTEEQLEALRAEYVICTPNDLEVATTIAVLEQAGKTLEEDDIEAIKVSSSPEFEQLDRHISQQHTNLLNTLVYGVTQLTLICAKLERQISCSWWVVFVPLWVFLGYQLVRSCCTCCLAGVATNTEADHDDMLPTNPTDATQDHQDEPDTTTAKPGPKAVATGTNNGPAGKKTDDPLKQSPEVDADGTENKDDTQTKEETKSMPKSQTFPQASQMTNQEEEVKANSMPKSKTYPFGGKKAETGEVYVDVIEEQPGRPTSLKQPPEFSTKFETAQSTTFFASAAQKEQREEVSASPTQEASTTDQEDIPDLDEEEAFRQWQRQHAQEADNAAMEAAASAQSTCCMSLFQLITACLIVSKLEDAYGSSGDEGMDAYWILFPLFLVAFMVLCCCCCLVYSTPDLSKMEEFIHAQQGGHEEGGDEEQPAPAAESPAAEPLVVVVPPEQPATSSSVHSAAATTTRSSEHDVEAPAAPVADDINDLD